MSHADLRDKVRPAVEAFAEQFLCGCEEMPGDRPCPDCIELAREMLASFIGDLPEGEIERESLQRAVVVSTADA